MTTEAPTRKDMLWTLCHNAGLSQKSADELTDELARNVTWPYLNSSRMTSYGLSYYNKQHDFVKVMTANPVLVAPLQTRKAGNKWTFARGLYPYSKIGFITSVVTTVGALGAAAAAYAGWISPTPAGMNVFNAVGPWIRDLSLLSNPAFLWSMIMKDKYFERYMNLKEKCRNVHKEFEMASYGSSTNKWDVAGDVLRCMLENPEVLQTAYAASRPVGKNGANTISAVPV